MKKQILALVLLASVITGFNIAKADVQSENLTSSEGLTSDPWEQCTPDELMEGCKKEVMPMRSRIQNLKIEPRQRVLVSAMDRNCEGQVILRGPQGQSLILQPSIYVVDSGDYQIVNNSMSTCQIFMRSEK